MNDQDIMKVDLPKDADEWFDMGVKLGEKGDFKGAIEAFKKGLKLNPEDVIAWINLGVAYGQIGDSQAEIEVFLEFRNLSVEPQVIETEIDAKEADGQRAYGEGAQGLFSLPWQLKGRSLCKTQ